MEPTSAIITALATGAAVGLSSVAEASVKDAYEAIKTLLKSRYAEIDLGQLEKGPESKTRQTLLGEELEAAGALEDDIVLERVMRLINLIQALEPQAGQAIGVDLEHIDAAGLAIKDVIAGGAGVHVRMAKTSGDITIEGVRAGIGGGSNPQKKKR